MMTTATKLTLEKEIGEALRLGELNGWVITPPAEDAHTFTVEMISPLDSEKYLIEFEFTDYPKQPFFIEFLHPNHPLTERGSKKCYPQGKGDSFFHTNGPAICHPCNRKAYGTLHTDWQLSAWKTIAGSITTLSDILNTIYTRISSNEYYGGRRMEKI